MSAILFLPLKLFLVGLDLLITILTFGWLAPLIKLCKPAPLRSIPVYTDESHRVQKSSQKELASQPFPGCNTLYDMALKSFKDHGAENATASREFLGMYTVKPPVKKFGVTKYRTFDDLNADSHKFGAALRKAGLVSAPDEATLEGLTTSCSLAIFENTCGEWLTAALGAFSQSVIVTTIYATLGMDAVADAIQEGVVRAVVCDKRSVGDIVKRIGETPTLKCIIYTNDCVGPDDVIDLPTAPAGIQIVSFDDFVASGDVKAFPPVPPKPTSMAVLMYTSGSTGKPKGVVIKHSNVVAAVTGFGDALPPAKGDVYLGYLPLAHIMELCAEFTMVHKGVTICYADPKTLTAKGAYPTGALEAFAPTIMAGVPKIWDVIKKGVEAKVNASSPVKKFLVQTAFEARTFAINHGYDTPLFNKLVFSKFGKVVGGRLRLALSGGGPCNAEVQVFIRTCFGCPLVQGYGLTETCAGLTMQDHTDLRSGIVGPPLSSVEVKLLSTPEIKDKASAPYLSTDTTDVNGNKIFGRGEVLMCGTNLSLGYYKMQDKTDEVYTKDGFFHTGDIGQFMSDGSLRIVDRVKNLVKLKGGEYIAIENMEMVYGNSPFVDAVSGGICVYGDGEMDRPVALMQLNEAVAMRWAKDNGVAGSFAEVMKSKVLNDAVKKDMDKEMVKGGLSRLEKLIAVCFLADPWTPENGCLTAANKLERRKVVEKFEKEFNETRAKGIFA